MDSGTVALQLEWMLMPLFCTCTGYSTKAVERKIEDGKWIEGRMYRRAPDGRITINLQEYYRWVSGASARPNMQERRMRAGERRRSIGGS
ncbi:excisionase [Massilia soli]|uniref:excisionase n=1 Tax=Massilia soli TaxID=2792854 RepID=UPI0027D95EAE|nr:excisionase [Massilia soli]